MMEESLPILVFRRFPKPILVRGKALPADQKKITIFAFQASLQFVREMAGHGRDDDPRFTECPFKCRGLSRADLQGNCFENHLPLAGRSVSAMQPREWRVVDP
jgi:hypothetical protein